MRAVVVEEPGPSDVLKLKEIPVPVAGAGEILIDVAFAGVGFVDTLFRAGSFPMPMPLVPGIEVSGYVRSVGQGVDGFEVGRPVVALLNDFGRGPRAGGYAEVAAAHSSMAAQVQDGTDLALLAGAAVNGVTAWIAIHHLARLGPHERAAVFGASGGLGSIACRLAAITPAFQVIGVVGSEANRRLAPAECTDVVVASEFKESVDRLTDGAGLDLVVDPVGGDLRSAAFEALAPFGRLLVLGDASGKDRAISTDAAWLGTRQVMGLSLGAVAHLVPSHISEAMASVTQLLTREILRPPQPTIRRLEEVAEVHEALEQRAAPPKTVLRVDSACGAAE